MADNYQQSGYTGQGQGQQRPVSTYNTHQDEFGFKDGSGYPAGQGGQQMNQPGGGVVDQGYDGQGYGNQGGDAFQDAPDRMTDMDSGVGGPKSGYGASQEGAAYDQSTGDQTQLGLGARGQGQGQQWSDTQSGQMGTGAGGPNASNFDSTPGSNFDSTPGSNYDNTPGSNFGNMPTSNQGSALGGDDWGTDDTSRTQGGKKEGLMSKIKDKLPGQHNNNTGTGMDDVNAPPKKGMMEKIKEKLPGNHGTDSGV